MGVYVDPAEALSALKHLKARTNENIAAYSAAIAKASLGRYKAEEMLTEIDALIERYEDLLKEQLRG
jgi:hypothetical protein